MVSCMTNMWVRYFHSLTVVKFKLYLLKTLQKLKNLKNLHSKNCVALENNIYGSLPSTVVTNMVYDYGGKFLSRWQSRKHIF